MLVNPKQMILAAQAGKYAIGSFNTSDLEITKAIIKAAQKLKAPVIVETSEKAISYAGLEELANIIREQAKKVKIPVAMHLDHGKSLEIVGQALDAGYTSVMFDGSHLSFTENQIFTRQAAEMAHQKKATCEGELGSIIKAGTDLVNPKSFTDPDTVPEFVRNTGVDFLAVSIGSQHGIGENEELDIDLLKKINSKTRIPLVLHGASGVPDGDIKKAIESGICKINIDTDIRHTFSKAIRNIGKDLQDPRDIMINVMTEIQKVVEKKIRLFGSDGKTA